MTTFEQLIGRYGERHDFSNTETEQIRSFSSLLEEAFLEYVSRDLVLGSNSNEFNGKTITRIKPFEYTISDQLFNLFSRAAQIEQENGTQQFVQRLGELFGSDTLWAKFSESADYQVEAADDISIDKTLLIYNYTSTPESIIGDSAFLTRERDSEGVIITFYIQQLQNNLATILTNHKLEVYGSKLFKEPEETERLFYSTAGNYRDLPEDPVERSEVIRTMRENMQTSVDSKLYFSYQITEGENYVTLVTTPYRREPYNNNFLIRGIV